MPTNICSNTNLPLRDDNLRKELNFIRRNVCAALTNHNFSNIPVYADNAAALAGGLINGDLYRTEDTLKIVHA